jgi:hypothetical protein
MLSAKYYLLIVCRSFSIKNALRLSEPSFFSLSSQFSIKIFKCLPWKGKILLKKNNLDFSRAFFEYSTFLFKTTLRTNERFCSRLLIFGFLYVYIASIQIPWICCPMMWEKVRSFPEWDLQDIATLPSLNFNRRMLEIRPWTRPPGMWGYR